MTTLHLKPRSGRRTSALGLVLSLALIFSASGIIGVNPAEPKSPCPQVGEAVGSETSRKHTDSYTVSPAVRAQGHPQVHHNL